VIGTLEEYPTEELAQAAINGLRTCINENRNRQMILPDDTRIMMQRIGPDECLGDT
jgi:hypothetical protein